MFFIDSMERPQKRRSGFFAAMDDSAFVLHPFFNLSNFT
jgi:phage-related protein